jgi:hypothetical protein
VRGELVLDVADALGGRLRRRHHENCARGVIDERAREVPGSTALTPRRRVAPTMSRASASSAASSMTSHNGPSALTASGCASKPACDAIRAPSAAIHSVVLRSRSLTSAGSVTGGVMPVDRASSMIGFHAATTIAGCPESSSPANAIASAASSDPS